MSLIELFLWLIGPFIVLCLVEDRNSLKGPLGICIRGIVFGLTHPFGVEKQPVDNVDEEKDDDIETEYMQINPVEPMEPTEFVSSFCRKPPPSISDPQIVGTMPIA